MKLNYYFFFFKKNNPIKTYINMNILLHNHFNFFVF